MFRFPSSLKLALALAVAPILSADASTMILNWGGKYTNSYAALTPGTATSAGGTTNFAWKDTSSVSPAGPNIYGGFRLSNSTGTGSPVFREGFFGLNPGTGVTNDVIRISATAESGTLTMRGLLYFKKEDFLVSSGPIRFDQTSVISLNVTSSTGATRQNRMAVYALVSGEWNWYLSQTTYAGTATYNNSPYDQMWAVYNPNGTEYLPAAPTGGSSFNLAGSAFEDIGALGIFVNYTQSSGNNATIYFNSFQVTAIPEPSGVAMAALGIVGFIGFRFYKVAR